MGSFIERKWWAIALILSVFVSGLNTFVFMRVGGTAGMAGMLGGIVVLWAIGGAIYLAVVGVATLARKPLASLSKKLVFIGALVVLGQMVLMGAAFQRGVGLGATQAANETAKSQP